MAHLPPDGGPSCGAPRAKLAAEERNANNKETHCWVHSRVSHSFHLWRAVSSRRLGPATSLEAGLNTLSGGPEEAASGTASCSGGWR